MKKQFIIFVFFLVAGLFSGYGQQDCSDALPICSDANSGGVVNGFGFDDFFGSSVSGCLRNGLGVTTIETNSYWFRIKLAASGEFGFNIIPNNLSEDWDFAVYGPNKSCGDLGEPIACNYSKASPTGYTGVGVDPSNGTQTDAYDAWMDVATGDEYVILINQYSGTNAGFSINWKGDVITNPGYLDCSIIADLGSDRDLCVGQSTQLNAKTFGASISYEWFLLNTISGVFEPFSPAKTGETLNVNSTGNYKVEVTDNITGDVLDDDILVTFHAVPTAGIPLDIILCDADGDGVEDFNLESNTTLILNGQSGMTVTYHELEPFAQLGTAPITSPYLSGEKTIWARIQNSANTDCYETISFEVLAAPPPIANQPPNLKACDNDNDGFMFFNLDQQTPFILNGQTAFVTYYENEANAIDRKGWILNSNAYPSKTATIWVRVEPSVNSACFAITTFNLEVFEKARANSTANILQCDFDNDGLYQFDFKALKDADILGSQSPLTFEVYYYATQSDADNNVNALPNPFSNITPYAQERIYARIQNKGFADCFETTSFTLQVLDTPYPAVPANIPNLSYCDDASDGDDANGFHEFDLTERETIILNGQSPYVFDVNYYRDSAYINQIFNPTAFPNSVANQQTVYVRVTNSNVNNVDCNADTSFIIEVKPLPNALLTPYDLVQCDEDGTPDGIVNFNLAEADFFVTIGDNNLNVTYYLSANDAASGINEVNKSSFSNNVSSTVFARVVAANGCYRIVPVNLSVSVTSFPANYPGHEITVCDDDATIDGLHEFNLAQVTSEIISLFLSPNLRVSYFRNQEDALSETNIISPTNAYLSEIPYNQTIWGRVESAINGNCFGIGPVIQLKVNPRPEFDLDETDIICLNDLPKTISTYNPLGTYTYEWTDDAGTVISDQPFAEISQAGVYTVMATSNLNCESFPKQITITESIIADISSDDIQIIDNSGNNSISINNAGQNLGIGDYEFALDDISGPYQGSPVFSEVIPGKHIIYVNDKNNCGIAQITVYVFGFPNFFTPNDDGQNDTWNVLGVDPSVFKASVIYIFDRYGKLMTSFSASQTGWNGFYKGNKAVSTDYWFLARMTDLSDETKEYKGHFSLIRR
jgi:gliding motility-associated-like protein